MSGASTGAKGGRSELEGTARSCGGGRGVECCRAGTGIKEGRSNPGGRGIVWRGQWASGASVENGRGILELGGDGITWSRRGIGCECRRNRGG